MSQESEKLFDAITQIDDALLPEETAPGRITPAWKVFAAIAAVLALLISPFALRLGSRNAGTQADNTDDYALAQPVYPEMAACPVEDDYVNQDGSFDDERWRADFQAWRESIRKQADQPAGYADGLEGYYTQCMRQLLAGSGGENRACSPVNIYMALAMLAETTGGESRAQILDLLGAESIDALRAQARSVWNANYRDDGVTTSVLASSLWLREGRAFDPDTVERLAQDCYASVFRGEMGSAEYDKALQSWLNEHTGGLLSEQTAQEHLDADTLLALATTIYYRAGWTGTFSEQDTAQGVFRGAQGDETADFMHQSDFLPCHYGEGFSAVGLGLRDGGQMWLLLPDEGSTPEALLENEDAMTFFLGRQNVVQECPLVHLTMPKFDVSSRVSLLDALKAMGVTDVCDPAKADFSPLEAGENGAYLSDATHAVRVTVDEEGVAAAAYTMMVVGEGEPDNQFEVTFTVDRPFLYVITGDQGAPLFAGIVNTMS